VSPELRIMLRPALAYEALLAAPPHGPFLALRRPALVALVIGTAIAVSATGRVTAWLVLDLALCWSFAPLLQVATAAVLLRSPLSRVGTGVRMDLWFAGHGPWSLWLLAVAVCYASFPATRRIEYPILATAIVPAAWTAIIGTAFCRTILLDTPARAWARVALHQAVTWTIVFGYITLASQLWPRFLSLARR
jgi:hypothetical protein